MSDSNGQLLELLVAACKCTVLCSLCSIGSSITTSWNRYALKRPCAAFHTILASHFLLQTLYCISI